MGNLLKIENIPYSMEKLNNSVRYWETSKDGKFLLRYPTVYIINDKKQEMNLKYMLVKQQISEIEQDSI